MAKEVIVNAKKIKKRKNKHYVNIVSDCRKRSPEGGLFLV